MKEKLSSKLPNSYYIMRLVIIRKSGIIFIIKINQKITPIVFGIPLSSSIFIINYPHLAIYISIGITFTILVSVVGLKWFLEFKADEFAFRYTSKKLAIKYFELIQNMEKIHKVGWLGSFWRHPLHPLTNIRLWLIKKFL